MTRREFTLESALAVLAGVTITISGCGDDDSPMAPTPPPGSLNGTVSANHGHTAFITAAQLMAGSMVSLDIRGSSTHPHTVNVSAAQMQTIAARQQVAIVSSSDDGHTHTVTFN
jgi:VCBS repeat-containing protein